MYLPNNSKTPPMYYITSTTNPFINSVKMHTNLKADFSNYIYFFLHPIFFSSKKKHPTNCLHAMILTWNMLEIIFLYHNSCRIQSEDDRDWGCTSLRWWRGLQKNYREKAMCCAVKDTVEAARGCAVVYRVYVGGWFPHGGGPAWCGGGGLACLLSDSARRAVIPSKPSHSILKFAKK